MIVAKDNEERRSQLWRGIIIVTTALIIVIAAFFIIKLFTENPLAGTWKHEDSNLTLIVKGSNVVTVDWPELFEDTSVKVDMKYVLDKEAKTIAFKLDENAISKVAKKSEGQFTESGLKSALGALETTYTYSVDQKKLTLTEREYGDQMVFVKK